MAKISKKAGIGIVAAAAVILAIAGGSLRNNRNKAGTAEDFGITQETAEAGQISKVVNGTGALAADDSSAVKVPVGAKVLEVYVEEGNPVKKGDRIAKLDAVSLKEIVVSLDESIDAKQEEIDELDTSDKHYQEKLEIAQAAIKDMRENRDRAAALAKDPVLVSDLTGIISAVNVKEGEKTTQSLQGTGGMDSIDNSLLSSLLIGSTNSAPSFHAQEYVMVSQELDPEAAGNGLSQENGIEEQGEPASGQDEPAQEPAAEASVVPHTQETVVQTEETVVTEDNMTASENDQSVSEEEEGAEKTVQMKAAAAPANQGQETKEQEQPVKLELVEIPFKNITLSLEAPQAGNVPASGISLPDKSHIKASIAWVPSQERFTAGSVYIAVIALQDDTGYCFPTDTNVPEVKIDSCKNARVSKYDLNQDGYPDTILAVCPYVTAPDSGDIEKAKEQLNKLAEEELTVVRQQLEKQIGLLLTNVTKQASGSIETVLKSLGSGMDFSGMDLSSLAGSAFSGMDLSSLSGLSSGDLSGLGGLTSASSASSYYETDAITVIPNEKVFLDINVDEMDINMLSAGQKARVTVDAIPGESFEGEIIRIASTKNSETSITGGSSSAKYTVRISLPWNQQMKFGMTADASITADTRDDVVLVPVDAVMVLNGEDVVYTSYDAEGNLTDPVPVETGLSDGTMAEILSGLESGDTICYVNTQYQSLFHQLETVEVE